VTPFVEGRDRAAVAAEIDRYNAAAASRRRAPVRGGWTPPPGAARPAHVRGGWWATGCTPRGAYEIWARLALPEALAALGGGTSGGGRR
jgi:hypothetical protein